MNLNQSLNRFRIIRRFGRGLNALLFGFGIALLLLLACGLLDAFLAFEIAGRTQLVTIAWIVLGVCVLTLLVRAWSFSRTDSALEADALIGEKRNPASTAIGIGDDQGSELSAYLANMTRERAADRIGALKISRILNWRSMLPALRFLVLPLVAIITIWFIQPEASQTILQRLSQPGTDLPPWSKLRFIMQPAQPSVVYGGELSLAVELENADELEHPVELWVRDAESGRIQKLSTYRESSSRYSKTLDSMIEPVDVAFACGKARSKWVRVDLLLQPRVLAGRATITPPAHTGMKPTTIQLTNDQLKVPEGALVSLTLESNRPLSPSNLSCELSSRPGEEPQTLMVKGTVPSSNQINFEWTSVRSSKLEISIRDIRGTPSASPLKLNLESIPDRAPEVELHTPGPFLYATPSSTLTIKGETRDEYGLADVRLVRTLKGFRDRSVHIAKDLDGKEFDFNKNMTLPDVGVAPGDMIEIYVEASDHNPTLLGRNSSSISKVLIISEDQYAEYIRAKTTLEQFNARYRLITGALDDAIEALKELQDALKEGGDPKLAKEALKRAQDAHDKATELLNQLADDFPAFETEKRLQELAREAAQELQPNRRELKDFDLEDDKEENLKKLQAMLDRIEKQKGKQQQMDRDAELMAQAASIMEMAARFRKIYNTQKSITKRIGTIAVEIRKGVDRNSRLLAPLADTQDANREALDDFAVELAKRLEKVDRPELDSIKQGAQDFLEALKLSDPQSVMTLAAEAGRNGNSSEALVQAELAKSLLEKLMAREDEFAAACRGNADAFDFNIPDVAMAMQQLLEGLLRQNEGEKREGQDGQPGQGGPGGQGGQGGPGGNGFGFGGNGQPGLSMMDVPVLGPERMSINPSQAGGQGGGQGKNPGPGKPQDINTEKSNWKPGDTEVQSRHSPDPESIPEAYRDAIKLYYSGDDR